MAKLPALLDLISSFGGAERHAAEFQARRLREAGLLSRGKRGTGAPEMSCGDAAILLLAGMATDAGASAPDVVCGYLCMRRHAVARTPPAGTPERALFDLAASAPSPHVLMRELVAHANAFAPPDGSGKDVRFRVSLDRVSRSVTFAVAAASPPDGGRTASPPADTFSLTWSSGDGPGRAGDADPPMAFTVTLGGDAFRKVGRLVLAGPAPRAPACEPDEEELPDEAPGLHP